MPASQLRFDTDLTGLLPAGGPAVAGYRTYLDRFGGAETVFVVVEIASPAPHPEALAGAAEAVAEALEDSPEVARARAGVEPEDERYLVEEVLPRAVLLTGAGPDEIAARLAPEAVAERVERLRAAALSPLGPAGTAWLTADPLGFGDDLLRRLGAGAGLAVDPATAAFLSEDRAAALVVVTPARAELEPDAGRALLRALARARERASARTGLPVKTAALGGSLYAAHDEAAFQRDLVRTVALATVLVGALVVLAFDGIAIPLAALLAMVAAQVWTAAALALGFGRVSAVGVGLGAILVGLGDDYVVHLAARFRDRIAAGMERGAAMAEAVHETAPGILSAALTTAAGFGVLTLARFRPVAELGLFVALGVLVVLLTTVLVAAPALALGARRWSPGVSRPVWRAFGHGLERLVGLALARSSLVLAVAALATLAAVFGIVRLELDADLRRLRPADPQAAALERRLGEQFHVGLDTATVVVPGSTLAEALTSSAEVARVLRASLPPGVRVTSPADWHPPPDVLDVRLRALARLPWARAAADLRRGLEDAGLDPGAFAGALAGFEVLADGRDPAPVEAAELPSWASEGIASPEPAVAVHVRLPLGAWPEGPPGPIREAVARAAPEATWASSGWLGAEIRAVGLADLRRLGTVALLVVAVGVVVSFRGRLRPSLLAGVPVLLGACWTFGLWGLLGRPLDLFALGVLPVLLAIGVDDGLHVLHAVRAGTMVDAVRRSGRGILLTNLTTSVGFGSLLLSQVPGLRNGGLLICLGNLLCLLATFLVLPAMSAAARAAPRRRSAPPTGR